MAQGMLLEQLLTKQQTELRKLGWQPPEAPPQERSQAAVSRFESMMWGGSGDDGVRELLLQYARSGSVLAMGVVLGLANDHGFSMTLAFCNKLLFTISTSGSLEASYTVLQWMSWWGHQPNSSSYSHVLMTAVARFDAATVLHIARYMRDSGLLPSAELLRHALLITYARLHWGRSTRGLELRRALAIHQEMWLHFLLEVGVPMHGSAVKVVGQVARGLEDLLVEPLPATAEWAAYAARCSWASDTEGAWLQDPGAARSSGSQFEAFSAELQLTARLRASRCQAPGHVPGAKVAGSQAWQPAGQWMACGSEAEMSGGEPREHWTHAVSMAWADGQSDEERWSTAGATDEDTECGQSDTLADAALRVATPLPAGDQSRGCDDRARPALPQAPSALATPLQGPAGADTKAPRGRRRVRFAAQLAKARDPGSDEEAVEARPQTSSEDPTLRLCYSVWLHSQHRKQQHS